MSYISVYPYCPEMNTVVKVGQPIANPAVVANMLKSISLVMVLDGEELDYVRDNFKNLPDMVFFDSITYTGDFAKFIIANWR